MSTSFPEVERDVEGAARPIIQSNLGAPVPHADASRAPSCLSCRPARRASWRWCPPKLARARQRETAVRPGRARLAAAGTRSGFACGPVRWKVATCCDSDAVSGNSVWTVNSIL